MASCSSAHSGLQRISQDVISGVIESHELDDLSSPKDGAVIPTSIAKDQNEPSAEISGRSKIRTIAVVIALFSAVCIMALSATIVATAAPTMCSDLGSASGYAWIGGAYIIANGVAVPIFAKLSDIWGRKLILLIATAMFFATSIICATAKDIEALIAGRALQGIAGGGLYQLVNITIADLFSPRERSLVYGYLQIIWLLASGIGPILGGSFAQSQSLTWRFCFWINLPVAGLAFTLLLIFLDVHNPRTKALDGFKAIDWAGSFTMLGFVVMLLVGLNLSTIYSWDSPRVISLLAVGSFMGVLFVLSEHKFAKYPLMPLELFRHRTTIACIVIGFVQDFVLMGAEYYLPLFFQIVYQVSPLRSGLLNLALPVTASLVAVAAGFVIHRTGRYVEIIRLGLVLMTLGFGLFIDLSPKISLGLVILFEIISGMGNGMLFQPPMIAMQAAVSTDSQSTATSSLGFARNMAAGLSVVIGGTLFQSGMESRAGELRAAGIPENIVEALTAAGAAANVQLVGQVTDITQRAVLQGALASSLRNLWIMYTVASACGLAASALLSHRALSEEHIEVKTGLKNE